MNTPLIKVLSSLFSVKCFRSAPRDPSPSLSKMFNEEIGQETAIFLENQPDKLKKGDKVFIKSTSEAIRAGAPKYEAWFIHGVNRRSKWCNVRKEHESVASCSRKMEHGGKWWVSQGSAEADGLIEKMLDDLEEEGLSISHTPDFSPERAAAGVHPPDESSEEDSDDDDKGTVVTTDGKTEASASS